MLCAIFVGQVAATDTKKLVVPQSTIGLKRWSWFSTADNVFCDKLSSKYKESNGQQSLIGVAQVYLPKNGIPIGQRAIVAYQLQVVLVSFGMEVEPNRTCNGHTLEGFLLVEYEEVFSTVHAKMRGGAVRTELLA